MEWNAVSMLSFAGLIIFYVLIAIGILLLLAMVLGLRAYKGKRPLMAGFIVTIIDIFYSPLRKMMKVFKRDPRIVDDISIVLRNHLNWEAYEIVPPNERVMLVPQCLRHTRCPAPMSSEEGFSCKICGLCAIAKFYKVGNSIGTEVYIAPGGRFAKRVLSKSKQVGKRAVLGVACHTDLYEGMLASHVGKIPAQGVPLTTEGCVATKVDEDRVIDMMLVGMKESEARKAREVIT